MEAREFIQISDARNRKDKKTNNFLHKVAPATARREASLVADEAELQTGGSMVPADTLQTKRGGQAESKS